MLVLKSLHIFFVMSWMVGIFYLPRIFVHYQIAIAENQDVSRLAIMANKLFKFMLIVMILAFASGVWLWFGYGIGMGQGWVHAKLSLIALLVAYKYWMYLQLPILKSGSKLPKSCTYYRFMNEISVFIILPIILLVVLKPF